MLLSSELSQLNILCVALALTNTTDDLSESVPTKTYILLPVFVLSIISYVHNLTRAAYFPNGFPKLS